MLSAARYHINDCIMSDQPILHRYQIADRAELFDLLRVSLPADDCARLIAQWTWKYEASPFTPADGPVGSIIRVGKQLVSVLAAYRLRAWMGGIECVAESRGDWVVHPDYRRKRIWDRVGVPISDVPVAISWGRFFSITSGGRVGWTADPVTPLLRILDAGSLLEHFTHSRLLGLLGAGASASARLVSTPFRRERRDRDGSVVRLGGFDDRVDALSERARRTHLAMVVRDHRYLNWRYCQRPDVAYTLFGVEQGSELGGFLVTRVGTHQGLRWGYLVDFLTPENSGGVLSSLVEQALDEFRGSGVAAASCYVTDAATRRVLFRHGFLPVRQRDPIHFSRLIHPERTDLRKFATLRDWYVAMGDSDFEMSF
jgi:hypothetical protein